MIFCLKDWRAVTKLHGLSLGALRAGLVQGLLWDIAGPLAGYQFETGVLCTAVPASRPGKDSSCGCIPFAAWMEKLLGSTTDVHDCPALTVAGWY